MDKDKYEQRLAKKREWYKQHKKDIAEYNKKYYGKNIKPILDKEKKEISISALSKMTSKDLVKVLSSESTRKAVLLKIENAMMKLDKMPKTDKIKNIMSNLGKFRDNIKKIK